MKIKHVRYVLKIISLLSILGFASAQEDASSLEATIHASAESSMQEVMIVASGFTFAKPDSTIVVGVPVRLVFKNEDGMEHILAFSKLPHVKLPDDTTPGAGMDYSEDALAQSLEIPASGQSQVETVLMITEPGAYAFYCNVVGHEGMTGVLTVLAEHP